MLLRSWLATARGIRAKCRVHAKTSHNPSDEHSNDPKAKMAHRPVARWSDRRTCSRGGKVVFARAAQRRRSAPFHAGSRPLSARQQPTRLLQFERQIGVVSVHLDSPESPDGASEGLLNF